LLFCRVVSPEGTYTLQAESEYERAEWIAALQVGPAAGSCYGFRSTLEGQWERAVNPKPRITPQHTRIDTMDELGDVRFVFVCRVKCLSR
jgi:hypothetical protein